jgi:hypothetical protein
MDVTCDTKKEIIISTLNINVSFSIAIAYWLIVSLSVVRF